MVCFDLRTRAIIQVPARPFPPPATSATPRPSLTDSLLTLYRNATAHSSARRCLHRSDRRLADTFEA
jgi:hypothetical protein